MAVGGGSLVNVDLCFSPTLPTVQFKIDHSSAGRIGPNDFTKADLEKAYEWVKSSIGTRVLSELEINANNQQAVGWRAPFEFTSQAVRPEYLPSRSVALSGHRQKIFRHGS